jgi:hypothetical protein
LENDMLAAVREGYRVRYIISQDIDVDVSDSRSSSGSSSGGSGSDSGSSSSGDDDDDDDDDGADGDGNARKSGSSSSSGGGSGTDHAASGNAGSQNTRNRFATHTSTCTGTGTGTGIDVSTEVSAAVTVTATANATTPTTSELCLSSEDGVRAVGDKGGNETAGANARTSENANDLLKHLRATRQTPHVPTLPLLLLPGPSESDEYAVYGPDNPMIRKDGSHGWVTSESGDLTYVPIPAPCCNDPKDYDIVNAAQSLHFPQSKTIPTPLTPAGVSNVGTRTRSATRASTGSTRTSFAARNSTGTGGNIFGAVGEPRIGGLSNKGVPGEPATNTGRRDSAQPNTTRDISDNSNGNNNTTADNNNNNNNNNNNDNAGDIGDGASGKHGKNDAASCSGSILDGASACLGSLPPDDIRIRTSSGNRDAADPIGVGGSGGCAAPTDLVTITKQKEDDARSNANGYNDSDDNSNNDSDSNSDSDSDIGILTEDDASVVMYDTTEADKGRDFSASAHDYALAYIKPEDRCFFLNAVANREVAKTIEPGIVYNPPPLTPELREQAERTYSYFNPMTRMLYNRSSGGGGVGYMPSVHPDLDTKAMAHRYGARAAKKSPPFDPES